MAMGYHQNAFYENCSFHETKNKDTTNTYMHYNCIKLTNCEEKLESKLQFCQVQVRLNGVNVDYGGRVEVFFRGKWGKICRNAWDFNDVKVICRQLGFEDALAEFIGSDVKEDEIPFVMSDVACSGSEPQLASCPRTDENLKRDVNVSAELCRKDDKAAQALCQPTLPKIHVIIPNNTIREGDSVNLTCIVDAGFPESQIRWTKYGTLRGQSNAICLTRVTTKDQGRYTCEAVNSGGSSSDSIYVKVQVPPQLNPEIKNRSIALNSAFATHYFERGDPPVKINWTENGERLGNNNTLVISYVTFEDAGIYECTAKNHAGIAKASFSIGVHVTVHPILIMEIMPFGDLLGFLRKSRGLVDKCYRGGNMAQKLETYDLVLFTKQIGTGMVFLGSRGIIHRDLPARNILLDNNYVCKVTDFGMAYQSFKYGHGNAKKGRMPIKWTAPEILLGNISELSPLSDVWSYGIVLYEIFTIGIPYQGWSEGRVVAEVTNGYQMPRPTHIDDQLYDIMTRCWNLSPEFRPPFEILRQRMDEYLRNETYLEPINMEKYDTVRFSKVEDLGAEDEGRSKQVTKSSAAKKLGKWASDRC